MLLFIKGNVSCKKIDFLWRLQKFNRRGGKTMKKFKIKHVISLAVLLVMLAVTLVPALAASTIGCDWNIGTGETHWNGKENGRIWDLGSPGEKRYNVSLLSSRNVSVHGSIFYVNEWSLDTWVTEVRFSGANGAWKG